MAAADEKQEEQGLAGGYPFQVEKGPGGEGVARPMEQRSNFGQCTKSPGNGPAASPVAFDNRQLSVRILIVTSLKQSGAAKWR
jgi:hypothetical protein